MRQSVDNQCAALGGGNGAGVGGQTVGLNRIDVGNAGELVYLGDEEHAEKLMGEAVQVGEAAHDLTHGHLVEQNGALVESAAVTVLLVGLGGENEVLCDVAEYIIDEQMAHAQVGAAQTHDVLIHEAVAAEVGDHPAVVQCAVERGNEVLGEGHKEHAPHTSPLIEVICGVLDAAPLTADGGHGALAVEAAEALLTVEDAILLAGGVESHEILVLALGTLEVGLNIIYTILTKLLPVGSLEEIPSNAADLFEVLPLLRPVDLIFAFPEFRIRILYLFLLCHYALPSSLWIRLISRDSTKA